MRTRSVKWAGFWLALSLPAWAGCIRVPAGRITTDRMDFGQVIQESWKRQTLLNVVRLRYADVPLFLDVASVINSYSLGGSASGGASLEKNSSANSLSLGAAGFWSNTPTVTYQPLMGERFTKSLLQPVAPAAVFQLMQGGLSPELVLRTVVRSINKLRNDSFGVAGDTGFGELIEALSRLQRAGSLGNRVEARKDGSALILILRPESQDTELPEDARRVGELLGLEKGLTEIEVVYGLAPRNGREIAIVTRTMLGIIMELAMGVELPADQAASGRAFSPPRHAGEAPATPHVRVRSGTAAPEDAYAAVPYKGHWYWIADDDTASKGTFTFLMILFSLAETGQASVAPLVTVPSR
jgi:hypothetical protein